MRPIALAALATALCGASLCTASFAYEYSPPAGSWHQVLSADTFEEVCTTSSAPCDLPADTYLLIDFGTVPETRSSLTIPQSGSAGTDPSNPLGLVYVDETCSIDGNVERCEVSCPVGSAVVGVTTCQAYVVDRDPGEFLPGGGGEILGVPTYFARIGTRTVECRAQKGSLVSADPRDDTIEVGAACAPYTDAE